MSCDRRCFDESNEWFGFDDCDKCPGADLGPSKPTDVDLTSPEGITDEPRPVPYKISPDPWPSQGDLTSPEIDNNHYVPTMGDKTGD